ncbi:WbqC family protein [Thioalbus denitrificans]|uniref:WbqC-like protein n=1 Tax=Thioalbus denitrificans TaxID=547122 RepID=A0A369CNK7_9GAMM|nr:WbqC family protein [Thioalbus denitrificans]RCX33454.1 WbqC-like protein [Thioalbus denitrificans]
MKLAIMQPYLFPYLGYFQLIRAVDAFVVYDDVNYIKGGWINRNFILGPRGKQLITLQLQGASPNKLINTILIGGRNTKLLRTIKQTYCKAPYFTEVYPVIEKILNHREINLSRFLVYQLLTICDYLNIQPNWYISSSLKKNSVLRGEDKVLAICAELGATHYINLPGGQSLYKKDAFASRQIQLSFIEPRVYAYRQFGDEFISGLSMVDVMMFNDKTQCRALLQEYELV